MGGDDDYHHHHDVDDDDDNDSGDDGHDDDDSSRQNPHNADISNAYRISIRQIIHYTLIYNADRIRKTSQ